jgi:hypothetical protein
MVDQFFARALAKNREERFSTAREFAGAYFRMLKRSAPTTVGTDTGQFLAVEDPSEVPDEAPPLSDSCPSFPSDSGAFSLSESNPLAVPVAEAGSQPGISVPGVAASHANAVPGLLDHDSLLGDAEPSSSSVATSGAPGSISAQVGEVYDTIDGAGKKGGRSKLLPVAIVGAVLVLGGGAFAVLRAPSSASGSESAPAETGVAQAPEPTPAEPSSPPPELSATATASASASAEPVEEPAPSASATASASATRRAPRPPTTRRSPTPPKPPTPPPAGGDEDLLNDRH